MVGILQAISISVKLIIIIKASYTYLPFDLYDLSNFVYFKKR